MASIIYYKYGVQRNYELNYAELRVITANYGRFLYLWPVTNYGVSREASYVTTLIASDWGKGWWRGEWYNSTHHIPFSNWLKFKCLMM